MRLNFGGYKWHPFDGYGRLTAGFAQALIRLGHNVYPFEIETLDHPAWYLRAQGLDFSHATVMLMPPSIMRPISGRNFIFTMHESENLPDGWAEHINTKAQWLLTPTPALLPIFERAGVKIPMEVVQGGIDPAECPVITPNDDRPFTFGCLGDRGSRKGHQQVWSAFYKAFDYKNRDVRLIVKCRPSSLPRLDFSYSNDPRISVWRADVDQVADIFTAFDAFMFPSKFEGYGMPPREAAACGIPTFVTRYSGLADDCDKWAVPLEKFRMVESNMEHCGGLWADPDVDELVWRMRDIYEHREEYRARAVKAAQWMRDNHTYELAAKRLIEVVGKYLGAPTSIKTTETTAPARIPFNVDDFNRVMGRTVERADGLEAQREQG